jgi:hypothetical protein
VDVSSALPSFPEPFRPSCEAGVDRPDSTSLKWGADGELTAQDLHHVLARLLLHDQEACRMINSDLSA